MLSNSRCVKLNTIPCVIIFFSILFSFQLFNLDADPSPVKGWNDIGDEGYWMHNARLKVLFKNIQSDDLKMAYLGAPLFNALTYISFKSFGVSYFSGRLVSIFSLWTIIIINWKTIYRKQ